MRYFIKPDIAVLSWLLQRDDKPHVLPVFPDTADSGLVVAHLLSGEVFAEVIPSPTHVPAACGDGLPLGRLYFTVPRADLYPVCENLCPADFGGSAV